MKYNPVIHHRRSIRLRGYDYSRAGAYFITICTQNRQCLFGKIASGKMRLNAAGNAIQTIWDELAIRFNNLELDAFVVMPNHIHGIATITRRGEPCVRPDRDHPNDVRPDHDHPNDVRPDHDHPDDVRPDRDRPNDDRPDNVRPDAGGMGEHDMGEHKVRPYGTWPGSIGRIVQAFKSITTHEYTNGVKQSDWKPFPGKLWQRNYWEHIVRDESDLNRIREYIQNNPAQWKSDKLFVGANLVFTHVPSAEVWTA